MKTILSTLVQKTIVVALVFTILVMAGPVSSVYAVGPDEPPTPPSDRPEITDERIEQVWARMLQGYDRQGQLLERAESFVKKVQELLDRLNENGKDTTALQAALDAYEGALKDAHPINESAKGIINSHKGFDADGKVTDQEQAIETLRALGEKLKEVRELVGDPGKALREAMRAFRESYRHEESSALQG